MAVGCRYQDEGVFEYIDDTFTGIERTTELASQTALSEKQTDRVHTAALKSMGKMGDDTGAIKVSKPVKGAAGQDGMDDNEGVEAVNTGEDSEDDEDHLLDPAPWARIFGRMRAAAAPSVSKRPAPKASARGNESGNGNGKKSKAVVGGSCAAVSSSAAAKPAAGRNRKRAVAEGADDEAEGPDGFGAKAPVPSGVDDQELITSYQGQVDALQHMDATDSSDTSFLPWCEQRITKLGELKQGSVGSSSSSTATHHQSRQPITLPASLLLCKFNYISFIYIIYINIQQVAQYSAD